tara:strand:+ start:810 stop:1028 length:219 start_codon:yes stop_codon:yes gene_type:complete
MTIKVVGYNKLNAVLLVTDKNTVFVGLTANGEGGYTQYYILDPVSSNLMYIEGNTVELTEALNKLKQEDDIK